MAVDSLLENKNTKKKYRIRKKYRNHFGIIIYQLEDSQTNEKMIANDALISNDFSVLKGEY